LEKEIWRHGSSGAQKAQRAGGGKPETQADVCGTGPGQQDSQRCSRKKVLSPADRKERVDYILESYPVGISRACGLIEYSRSTFYYKPVKNDLKVVDNPAFTRVVMKGTENAPEAMAYVYWNQQTSEVYLRIQSLKQLAQENQYQLWAIVDGKPVDAGVFDGIENGLLKMKELTGAAAFAVTIEPRGGKPSPTLETLQVIGNTPKNAAI